MDNLKIGNLIAELRKEKKLTQKELADKLFVSDRAISKWENGRGIPDISLLERLAQLLGISISELLKGERIDKMNKNNADKIFKESIPFFQKKYFKKKFTKIILIILAILIVGHFIILCIGQATYGSLSWRIFDGGYSIDLPSFSSKMTRKKAERFLEGLKNYDYDRIKETIAPNFAGSLIEEDEKMTEDQYIDNLQFLEKSGVKFIRYKYQFAYHNNFVYMVSYDLEITYKNERYTMQVQLKESGRLIATGGPGYTEVDPFKINNPYINIKDKNIVERLERVFWYYI